MKTVIATSVEYVVGESRGGERGEESCTLDDGQRERDRLQSTERRPASTTKVPRANASTLMVKEAFSFCPPRLPEVAVGFDVLLFGEDERGVAVVVVVVGDLSVLLVPNVVPSIDGEVVVEAGALVVGVGAMTGPETLESLRAGEGEVPTFLISNSGEA